MDFAYDSQLQDGVDAERTRMNAFQFGRARSPSGAAQPPPSRHSRSHSRNSSVSVPMSLPTPVSATPDSPPQSPTRNSISGAKRNSHHRRRSSVSTRRESADLMGVSLPTIPLSSPEDNINLGDKDSIRRRALMALEGRDAGGSFSVEIPDSLDAPEAAKRNFDFPTKPSFPPGMGAGFNGGLSTLMSKRDSIRCMTSTSSSEPLGTLVEEEEEEEETKDTVAGPVQESPVHPVVAAPLLPRSTRTRPASLNLRPLSLAVTNSFQAGTGELSSPSPTPTSRPGLRSLTLASANAGFSSNAANKRQSLTLLPASTPSPLPFNCRPSLNLTTDSSVVQPQPNRRSSIGYVSGEAPITSTYGLPTPEMTPTSSTVDRHRSTSASSSGSMDLGQLGMQRGRPLSMSEQHFLFQAHETLVQRITDLERSLARRSRPVSCASDVSSVSNPSEPSDEMLQMLADLKAERDELKKDVDGWRTRVSDLQHQIDIHAKRVETERRDAWVARQRVGLLEIEKESLIKTVADKTAEAEHALARCDDVAQQLEQSQDEVARLKSEVERMRSTEDECTRLRAELLQERKRREDRERELELAGLLDTPRPFDAVVRPITTISRTAVHAKSRGLGFRSIDSESSFTDVESVDDNHCPELKAVEEVDEVDDMSDDEDDELACYEDEASGDEYDYPTSTSYESMMEYRSATPRLSTDSADSMESAPSLVSARSPSVSPSPLPSPLPSPAEPTHARHASLVIKAWTFPSGPANVPVASRVSEEVDRFFGCLDDVDNSPPLDSRLRSEESGKNLFAQGLVESDDDLPPFVLPSDVGELVPEAEPPVRTLDIVVEEEEEEEDEEDESKDVSYEHDEEFVGEVDEGGIKFTFNPPPSYFMDSHANSSTPDLSTSSTSTPESVSKSGPVFEPIDEDEDDASFTFPQLKSQRSAPAPSGIPRLRSSSPFNSAVTSTPPKVVSPLPLRISTSYSTFSTPPPKRAATAPTFIPQPSPSKSPSSLPQPPRAWTFPRPSAIPVMTPPASTDASRSRSVTPRAAAAPDLRTPPTSQPPVSSPASTSPSLPFMSPTLAARLSFQKITNFIPVPSLLWSPRSSGEDFDSSPRESPAVTSGSPDHTRTTSTFVNGRRTSVARPEMPKERTFVPKEKQLEKLRIRMEEERRRGQQTVGLGVVVKKTQRGLLDI